MSWTESLEWALPESSTIDKQMIAGVVVSSASTLLLLAAVIWDTRKSSEPRKRYYNAKVALATLCHYTVWYLFFWLPWTRQQQVPAASPPWAAGELLFVCVALYLYERPYMHNNSRMLAISCFAVFLLAAGLALFAETAAAAWAVPPATRVLLFLSRKSPRCQNLLTKFDPAYVPLASSRQGKGLVGKVATVVYCSCTAACAGALVRGSVTARTVLVLLASSGLLVTTWLLFLQPGIAGVDVNPETTNTTDSVRFTDKKETKTSVKQLTPCKERDAENEDEEEY